jgi:hypothetical protein
LPSQAYACCAALLVLHPVVPVATTGHCAGTAELESVAPSPLPSFVHLNMSCNVVVIQKGDVLSTFERAIAAFSRPMDPDYVEGDQQVSYSRMKWICMTRCILEVALKGCCVCV